MMTHRADTSPSTSPGAPDRRVKRRRVISFLVFLAAVSSAAFAISLLGRPPVMGQAVRPPEAQRHTGDRGKRQGPEAPLRAPFSGQFGATLLSVPWLDAPNLDEALRLADITQCEACHEEVAAEWRDSAHANSSLNNPFYRRSVASYRDARGAEAAKLCAGCHDPLMLVGGTFTRSPVQDAPLATAGISCLMCHATRSVTMDGNASLTLSRPDLTFPRHRVPSSIAQHREEMRRDVLDEAAFCGSCHRGTLSPDAGHPHVQSGIDDLSAYLESPFSGNEGHRLDPISTETCQDCHMPESNGHRSHRFAGAHTALATSDEQRQAVTQMLKQAVSVHAPAATQEGKLRPLHEIDLTRPFELLVMLRNEGTGHRFPGGIGDTQDTFIELERVPLGREHSQARLSTPRHRLATLVLGADGLPVIGHEVESFFAPVANRTIPSRREQLVRYRFPPLVEALATDRVELKVRLKHRPHTPEFHTLSCASDGADARLANGEQPCRRPLPEIEIAETLACVGAGCEKARTTPSQWISLAYGLLSDVQEQGEWALVALDYAERHPRSEDGSRFAAYASTPEALTDFQLMAARAETHARMGRIDEVTRLTARMRNQDAPRTVARVADCIEGRALLRTYRFTQAEARLSACVEGQSDYENHRALILAGANAGASTAETARRIAAALERWPRSGELYRLQAINPSPSWARGAQDAAFQSFDLYRPLTRAAQMAYTCDTDLPGCASWQLGVAAYDVLVAK